jgi:hypothetical protein
MFNYKRLTFILIFLSFLLTITDSTAEKQARKSLLSLVNIIVDESSTVSETAPSSFLDSLETGRLNLYNYLDKQEDFIDAKSKSSKSPLSILFSIVYYIIIFLKFITNYVITFYPFIVFLLFMFFTSRFFKKDEFGYGDY